MQIGYRLDDLAKRFDLSLFGEESIEIHGIASLADAGAGQIAFLDNPKYQKFLATTQASAVVLSQEHASACSTNKLITNNPYLAYAKIATLFAPNLRPTAGIHPTAVIADSATVHPSASIGPHVVIEEQAEIGANVIVRANCVIGQSVVIGDDSMLWPNVSIFYGVHVGKRCEIYSGVVIGSDGFGFAPSQEGWFKIPQLGTVIIGDDVSIGSNTTIDRGSTLNTVIGNGVKLDNLIQIAHNVNIGDHTVVAGCTGIAGSTTIGKHCQIGGGAGIAGHITITDYVGIAGMSPITKSIHQSGQYIARGMGVETLPTWLKFVAKLRHLVGEK